MSIAAIKKLRRFTTFSLHERGFTLIELLIVIAVLGVLAAGVLIAINPAEQLARARDSSRKTTIGQLSRALQAYYTSQQSYPTANATWITTLVNAGEIKSTPGATTYSVISAPTCTIGQNGYCYNATTTGTIEAVVYIRLESTSENSKCASGTPNAYFLWSSTDSKAGVVCQATTGQPSAVQSYTFQ